MEGDERHGSVFQRAVRTCSLDWGDNSIGGLAKEAGFDEVYYADITTLSDLDSYFRMERVRVYGHRKDSTTPPTAARCQPRREP